MAEQPTGAISAAIGYTTSCRRTALKGDLSAALFFGTMRKHLSNTPLEIYGKPCRYGMACGNYRSKVFRLPASSMEYRDSSWFRRYAPTGVAMSMKNRT
jgi:hypothetical protein